MIVCWRASNVFEGILIVCKSRGGQYKSWAGPVDRLMEVMEGNCAPGGESEPVWVSATLLLPRCSHKTQHPKCSKRGPCLDIVLVRGKISCLGWLVSSDPTVME